MLDTTHQMNEELTFLPLTIKQVDDIIWLTSYISQLPEPWQPYYEWWLIEVARGAITLPENFHAVTDTVDEDEVWTPKPDIPRNTQVDYQEEVIY